MLGVCRRPSLRTSQNQHKGALSGLKVFATPGTSAVVPKMKTMFPQTALCVSMAGFRAHPIG